IYLSHNLNFHRGVDVLNCRNRRRVGMRKGITVFLLLLVCSTGAFAQATAGQGAVSGSIRDASGAIVPGAMVVLTNEVKGVRRTMVSSEAGVFAAPALLPAAGYKLAVSLQGFRTWESNEFTVQV